MGTVKYTGPVASFHCPTNAEIRSLKVHFSPKQEGSGDPSPENVREIVGWDGVFSSINKINIADKSNFMLNKSISWGGQKGTYGNFTTTDYHASFLFHIPQGATLTLTCYNSDTYWVDRIIPVKYNSVDWNSGFLGYYNYALYGNVTQRLTTRTWTMPEEADGLIVRFRMVEDIAITQELFDNLKISCVIGSVASEVYEPYQGSTTNYEFGVLGKNKLNTTNITHNNYNFGGIPNTLSPNTIYTYSINGSPTYKYRLYLSTGDNAGTVALNSSYLSGGQNATFITPSDISNYQELVLAGNANEAGNEDFSTLSAMIELGSTATTYEPYDPKHTVYGGWVDLITGEVCEEYKITNAEDLQVSYYTRVYEQVDYFDFRFKNRHVSLDTLCNVAKYCSTRQDATGSGVPSYWIGYLSGSGVSYPYIGFSFPSTFFSTHPTADNIEDSYQEILNKCSILFTEQLSTPNIYYLAPTQLQTFLGQNNVWSNADYVEVEYDLHETQDILNRKAFIIANQPHIVKPAAASLQNFKTDLVAPLKECKVYFNPVQDLHGYDSPWVGGAGKNLLDMTDENIVIGKYISNSGVVTDNSNNFYNSKYIPVKPNTTYTLSTSTAISYCSFMEYDENKEFITRTLFGKSAPAITSETITTTENTAYILIGSNVKYSSLSLEDVKAISWQLEQGASATSWVPYENVCPISGWTGVEVYRTGKNLLDTATSDEIVANWEVASSGYNKKISGLPVGQRFTLQANITKDLGENISNYRFYLNGSRTSGVFFNTGTPLGIHSTNNEVDNNGELHLYHNYAGLTRYGVEFNNIQLEFGGSATSYEPYIGTTLPIDWTTEAGTVYGGYVDLVKGEVVETYHKIILDGTTTNCKVNRDYSDSTYIVGGIVYLEPAGTYDTYSNSKLFCDTMPILAVNDATTALPYIRTISAGNQYLRIYLANTEDYPELDTNQKRIDFVNAYLVENPITVVYPLMVPQLVATLTPTQLKTLRGTNNIWANNNGGNIEVAYWSH